MEGPTAEPLLQPMALAIAFALVLLNAVFVAAEYAYVRIRPSRLKELARAGSVRAAAAARLVDQLEDTISACQVGVTLCSLGLGYIGEPAFAALVGAALGTVLAPVAPIVGPFSSAIAFVGSFLLVTFLLVVLGELLPKRITIAFTERLSLLLALPIRWFGIAFRPLVWLLSGSARALFLLLRLRTSDDGGAYSREEIRQLLTLSAESGQIGALEISLLDNLFRFAQRRTRDAMVPRGRVAALDVGRPLDELLARSRSEGYSRYPLIEGDLDRVLGVVHVKELPATAAAAGTSFDLRRIARPPIFVPETLSLERLLRRFQTDRAHLAIVADEYGAVVGIVTLEDVLEELVGELRDEFDADEQDPVRPRPGGGYLLDPALPFAVAAELVPEPPDPIEGVHTLAGLLQSELGRIPRAGDRVPFGPGHELLAAAVQGTRIQRLELVPRPPATSA